MHVLIVISFFFYIATFCTSLPAVANGMITYSTDPASSYDYGTNATLTCNFGFFLEGTEVRTCSGDGINIVGTWSGQDSACSGKLFMELYIQYI